MKEKQRKGISLITLVITIVVIVILVGAIVLSISNNNPINQAQKAVIMQDITSMIEEHDLIYITELGKYNGDTSKITDEAFAGVVPAKYQPDFTANKESLEYNCKDEMIKNIIKEMNTEKVILTCERIKPIISDIEVNNITDTTAEIKIVAMPVAEGSTIVSYKYSIDDGITYKESSANIITITDLPSGKETIVKIKVVDSYRSESEEKEVAITTKTIVDGITIPDEFYYVGGTKDTGIVISDNISDKDRGDSYEVAKTLVGNQYVWIPVANESEFERKDWRDQSKAFSDYAEPCANGYPTEVAEYNEMKEKVLANHGFYIARYEASNNGGTAESKALKMPWINIRWSISNSMNVPLSTGTASYEGRHVSDKLGYKSVQSTLIYGAQWDSALKFIEKSGTSMSSSISWGNYSRGEVYNYTTTNNTIATKNTTMLIPTGATERHMKQNISDMAGNAWEWTMETCMGNSRVERGGEYGGTVDYMASYRMHMRFREYKY